MGAPAQENLMLPLAQSGCGLHVGISAGAHRGERTGRKYGSAAIECARRVRYGNEYRRDGYG